MKPALSVQSITKSFGGLKAADDVSFEVAAGDICGFIGPNGAGKTTSMRIISTLDMPDSGDVFVDGHSVLEEPRLVRKRLGFMPDSYGAYSNMTVLDYLDFFARAYELRGAARRSTMSHVVEFTGLEYMKDKLITALSKGMKQRLCLAKTLLHDPKLLILDEPAAGLDPRARVELRELVSALAANGKAVLISSHILTELSELCNSVVVIESGRVCGTGTLEQIMKQLTPHARIFIRALADDEVVERILLEQPHVSDIRGERGGFTFTFEGDQAGEAQLLARLAQASITLIEFSPEEVDLEDIFLSLTEGLVQ